MSWSPEATTGVFAISASGITLLVTQWFQRGAARDARSAEERRAQADRVFAAREARYADRKHAVVEFLTAVGSEVDSISGFEEGNQYGASSPGDVYPEYEFPKMSAAYAQMVILVPADVATIADDLQQAVIDAFNGQKDAWATYRTTLTTFQAAARQMLAEGNLDYTSDPVSQRGSIRPG